MKDEVMKIEFVNYESKMIYDDFFEILLRHEENDIERCIDLDRREYLEQISEKYLKLNRFFEKYFYNKYEIEKFDVEKIYSDFDIELQKEIWKYYKTIQNLEKR